MTQRKNFFEISPRADFTERIEAENKKVGITSAILAHKEPDRVDGIRNSCPLDFDRGNGKVRIVRRRKPHHFEAIAGRRDSFALLVWRTGCRNEEDPIEGHCLADLLCAPEVAPVDRVEGPTKKPDPHEKREPGVVEYCRPGVME